MRLVRAILRIILTVLGVLLLATVLFLGYGLIRNTASAIVQPATTPVPAPSAVATPVPAPAVTDPTPVLPTPASATIVPDLKWLEVFGEIDQTADISRAGLQTHDFRYEVVSGETAAGALVATESGKIARMRVAPDDIVTGIWLLKADKTVPIDLRQKFVVLHSPKAIVPTALTGVKIVEFSAVKDWSYDAVMGANNKDILNQWVAVPFDIEMQKGDMLVISVMDDAGKRVNVGVSVSLEWIPAKK